MMIVAYLSMVVFSFVLMPFAYFYYEEDDPDSTVSVDIDTLFLKNVNERKERKN